MNTHIAPVGLARIIHLWVVDLFDEATKKSELVTVEDVAKHIRQEVNKMSTGLKGDNLLAIAQLVINAMRGSNHVRHYDTNAGRHYAYTADHMASPETLERLGDCAHTRQVLRSDAISFHVLDTDGTEL